MKKCVLYICSIISLLSSCNSNDLKDKETSDKSNLPTRTIPSELIIGRWNLQDLSIIRHDTTYNHFLYGRTIYTTVKDSFPSFIFNDKNQVLYDSICVGEWKTEGYSIVFTDKDSLHKSPIYLSGSYNIEVPSKYRMKLNKVYSSHSDDKIRLTYFFHRIKE